MKKYIPVTIVSGFLGSGKTTLINRLLNNAKGIHFALIINEFGEIGLDANLINNTQDFVKMDNGCLCCVLSDELVSTIAKLKERDDYDAIVLETTGIADPLPIAWPFLREEFEDKFRFAGIVTVVDALHFEKMLTQGQETRLQIERADFLYISKADLCDNNRLVELSHELKSINPNARVVTNQDKEWMSLMFDYKGFSDKMIVPKDKSYHQHKHSFQSYSLSLKEKKISLDALEDFFEALPKEVFRAKAIFKNEDNGELLVMHSVCGRIDFHKLENHTDNLGVVFIGKNFDEIKLESSFKKIVKS